MAKILIAVGVVALAIVAAPVAAALLTGAGLAGAMAAAGTALATFGTNLVFGGTLAAGLSAWSTVAIGASIALAPSAHPVGKGAAGSQVDFQADPMGGIPLMLGRSGTAGKVIHANTSGQANKNVALFYLLALTGGPLGGFESLTASDFLCTFDQAGVCTSPAQYAGFMFLNVTPGNKPDTQAYWPHIQAEWMPEWNNNHLLSGVSCVWWTLNYDAKAFPSGMPKPLFTIRGPAVYDPRADSTFPGGSGTQRWNNPDTWSLAGQDNPFLQALTWCIGRYDNGKLTFGIGAPLAAIDVPAFVEGANVCEANAWTVGGEVLSSDRKWDVLTSILQAGGGEPVKLGGQISCYVRTPKVALGTLAGTELVDAASITGSKRRRDRINQIIPTYRSEDHQWTLVPAGAVFVNEYIQADGGLRSREGTYALVQDPKQVAQLATYDILDAREFEPIVLPVGPRWQSIRPGDCIIVDEPEFGMAAQQVIVQTRELDLTTGKVTLTCRSETPGKHDYALGRTASPPPIPGLQPMDPGYVSRPDAGTWTAWGGVLSGADGSQVPAIVVTGAVNDPNVTGVIVDWALQLSPGVFGDYATTEAPAKTRRIEIRAVVSGATYHVQVRYRSVRDVEGALALDLGLVTVGTSISSGVTTIGGQTPQELVDQLNETTALGLETSDTAIQNSKDIATNADQILFTQNNLYEATHLPDGTDLETYTVNAVTSGQLNNAYSITRVDAMGILRPDGSTFQLSDTTLFASATETWGAYKTSLQTTVDGNTAAITSEQLTRANADGALSSRIDSVTATAGGNTAAISDEQNARVQGDNANASHINNVETTVNGHTASITGLTSSVNGLNAQWVLSVAATGPGYARVAGIKVAANPAVSSIAFQADQIGFTNASGSEPNVFPLAVVGGKVYATHFQADDIKANTITTDKIVANNIDATVVALIPGSITLTSSGTQLVTTGSITTTGGFVDLVIWGNVSLTGSGGSIGCQFDLYIDGNPITTFGQYCFQPFAFNPVTFAYRYHLPAGVHTHQVYGYKQSGGGPPVVNAMTITMTERKTQA